jgi:enoyl-CoA hydratase
MIVDLLPEPDNAAAASQLAAELAESCDQIAWDEEIRAVVLTFPGELIPAVQVDPSRREETGLSLVEPVARLKQPVIAAIKGNALGLGLELALACDIRIGIENAHFGLPQIRQGRMPSDGGTQRLPRLVGQGKAMEMILTGESIDAAEAYRIGLINRIVPAGALTSTAEELARDMAGKSPLSLRFSKEALYSGMDLALDPGLKMELDLYLLMFTTQDREEGINAFKEKRKPEFRGI